MEADLDWYKACSAAAMFLLAFATFLLSRRKDRRDVEQGRREEEDKRAEISLALRRKQAEREAIVRDDERGRLDIESRRIRVIGQFRRDCATATARMAAQNVRVDYKVIEGGPAGLARAKAEDVLNLELVKHEHDIKQQLARVDSEIEILKDKLAVARSRAA